MIKWSITERDEKMHEEEDQVIYKLIIYRNMIFISLFYQAVFQGRVACQRFKRQSRGWGTPWDGNGVTVRLELTLQFLPGLLFMGGESRCSPRQDQMGSPGGEK